MDPQAILQRFEVQLTRVSVHYESVSVIATADTPEQAQEWALEQTLRDAEWSEDEARDVRNLTVFKVSRLEAPSDEASERECETSHGNPTPPRDLKPPSVNKATDLLRLTPLELCEHFQIRIDERQGPLLADTALLEQLKFGELCGFSARLHLDDESYYFGANNFDGEVEMQLGKTGDIPTLYGVD